MLFIALFLFKVMPAKKKTNFISYELKKLNNYMEQLQDFLDNNPPNLAVDRMERIPTRTGEMIKIIAYKEDQVKAFMAVLEKLPKVLEDINRLRKEVETDKKEVEIRGGAELAGIMDDNDDEIIEEDIKIENKKSKKTNKYKEHKFDDESFFEEDQRLIAHNFDDED